MDPGLQNLPREFTQYMLAIIDIQRPDLINHVVIPTTDLAPELISGLTERLGAPETRNPSLIVIFGLCCAQRSHDLLQLVEPLVAVLSTPGLDMEPEFHAIASLAEIHACHPASPVFRKQFSEIVSIVVNTNNLELLGIIADIDPRRPEVVQIIPWLVGMLHEPLSDNAKNAISIILNANAESLGSLVPDLTGLLALMPPNHNLFGAITAIASSNPTHPNITDLARALAKSILAHADLRDLLILEKVYPIAPAVTLECLNETLREHPTHIIAAAILSEIAPEREDLLPALPGIAEVQSAECGDTMINIIRAHPRSKEALDLFPALCDNPTLVQTWLQRIEAVGIIGDANLRLRADAISSIIHVLDLCKHNHANWIMDQMPTLLLKGGVIEDACMAWIGQEIRKPDSGIGLLLDRLIGYVQDEVAPYPGGSNEDFCIRFCRTLSRELHHMPNHTAACKYYFELDHIARTVHDTILLSERLASHPEQVRMARCARR